MVLSSWSAGGNWVSGVAPQVGDALVFPAGASSLSAVNDFAPGTSFASIDIQSPGYDISGTSVELTGSLNASLTSGLAIDSLATKLDGGIVDVAPGGQLFAQGIFSGTAGLELTGGGTMAMIGSAANSYSGREACVVVVTLAGHPWLRWSWRPLFRPLDQSDSSSTWPRVVSSLARRAPRSRIGLFRLSISVPQTATAGSFSAWARNAAAIGLRLILPSVPSRRGAWASRVANTACTASTTPTCAKNRRDPLTFPSSTPQYTFSRALTRSTAVRPLYIRSNFFVARGNDGNRLGSTPRGTRTVLPYVLPALHTADIGHSNPSCFAGQRYFSVSRSGS